MLQSTCYYSLSLTGRPTTYLYDSMTVISSSLTKNVILPLVTLVGHANNLPGNAAQRKTSNSSSGETLVSL